MSGTATIWKFPLVATDHQTIEMPLGAEMLCVDTQGGKPFLWALCHPTAPKEQRGFWIHGTGHPIDHPLGDYVGTFQMDTLGLVFHVFEARR